MLEPFEKLIDLKNDFTTYRMALLQARATRSLNANSGKVLKAYSISPSEWALIGLLCDTNSGLRVSDLSSLMGVEKAYVTQTIGELRKKKFISINLNHKDKREKIIILTPLALSLIPEVEDSLSKGIKFLLADASKRDMLGYRSVLRSIVKNSKK